METPKSKKGDIDELLGAEASGHTAADPSPKEPVEKVHVEVAEDKSEVRDVERSPVHWHIEAHPDDPELIVASHGMTGKVFTGTRKAFCQKYYRRF